MGKHHKLFLHTRLFSKVVLDKRYQSLIYLLLLLKLLTKPTETTDAILEATNKRNEISFNKEKTITTERDAETFTLGKRAGIGTKCMLQK